jgi:hypothetical protein
MIMRTIDGSVHALNDERQMVQGMKQFLTLVRQNLYEGGGVEANSAKPIEEEEFLSDITPTTPRKFNSSKPIEEEEFLSDITPKTPRKY